MFTIEYIRNIFIFSSVLQLFFITLIFIRKKDSNKYFAAILIVLAFTTLSSYIVYLLPLSWNNPIRDILRQTFFLPGPVLYLYFKTFYMEESPHFKNTFHFIPFFLFTFLAIFLPDFISIFPDIYYFSMLSAIIALIFNTPYFILVSRLYKKLYKKNIICKNGYYWLHFYIFGLLGLWLIKCGSTIIDNIFRLGILDIYEYDEIIDPIIPAYFIIVTIYIYLIIYSVITRKNLCEKEKKYKNSLLTETLKNQLKQKLELIINKDQIYLDPELNLQKLAEKLDILPKNLSQIINEKYKLRFNDFINLHRIEYSKKLLLSEKKTIIEIIFSSGFNSKSAFNTAFKKHTNMTPKEFKKMHIK